MRHIILQSLVQLFWLCEQARVQVVSLVPEKGRTVFGAAEGCALSNVYSTFIGRLWSLLVRVNKKIFKNLRPVYNGKKNMYTREPLPLGNKRVRLVEFSAFHSAFFPVSAGLNRGLRATSPRVYTFTRVYTFACVCALCTSPINCIVHGNR